MISSQLTLSILISSDNKQKVEVSDIFSVSRLIKSWKTGWNGGLTKVSDRTSTDFYRPGKPTVIFWSSPATASLCLSLQKYAPRCTNQGGGCLLQAFFFFFFNLHIWNDVLCYCQAQQLNRVSYIERNIAFLKVAILLLWKGLLLVAHRLQM